MRRMLWRLPTVVALLLMLALAGMWVRSRWMYDSLAFEHGEHYYHVSSLRGRIGAVRLDRRDGIQGRHWHTYPLGADDEWIDVSENKPDTLRVLGVWAGTNPNLYHMRWLAVPYWIPMLILSPLVLFPPTRFVRRVRRIRRGLCVRCGYDLRASPTQCPECGFSMA